MCSFGPSCSCHLLCPAEFVCSSFSHGFVLPFETLKRMLLFLNWGDWQNLIVEKVSSSRKISSCALSERGFHEAELRSAKLFFNCGGGRAEIDKTCVCQASGVPCICVARNIREYSVPELLLSRWSSASLFTPKCPVASCSQCHSRLLFVLCTVWMLFNLVHLVRRDCTEPPQCHYLHLWQQAFTALSLTSSTEQTPKWLLLACLPTGRVIHKLEVLLCRQNSSWVCLLLPWQDIFHTHCQHYITSGFFQPCPTWVSGLTDDFLLHWF